MINFRKIASVLTSTVMIGSSVALAAAATFPSPFVMNGSADVAVVYGANANIDLLAVLDLTNKLSSELAAQTATDSGAEGASTVSGGDFVKLERSNDVFNLGNTADSFYTTLDEGELSKVLAMGIYTNDDNDDFDFEQQIALGTGTFNLSYFEDTKFNKDDAMIGFDLSRNAHIMNYTLEFTPDSATHDSSDSGVDFNLLETTDLTMLGRTYYIVDASGSSNGVKITLLDSANSAIVTEGETKTVQVGDQTYDVSIVFVSEDDVKLNVNGVTTNSLEEGDVFKVATDTYVAIKDILARDKTGTIDKVEFSIGSGKIVMENGQEVQLNNEDISDIEDANGDAKWPTTLTSYITNSSSGIEEIVLSWDTNDDAWLVPGTDLILPGFETIKISMGEFNMPAKEMTTISDDDSVVINTVVADGDLELPILAANSSFSGFDALGRDSDEKLVTNSSTSDPIVSLNETEDSYFVATWIDGDNGESYAYQIDKVDDNNGKNSTTLSNLASGGSDVAFSEVGDIQDVGQLRFTLVSASDALGTARVKIQPTGSASEFASLLVTNEGLQIRLPVDAVTTADGNVNVSGSVKPTQHIINFTEEDSDGNIGAGNNFLVTATGDNSNSGTEPSTVSGLSLISTADNDVEIGYVTSDLATKVTLNSPNNGLNDLELEYHGDESFADVFISESGAAVVGSSGGSSGVQTLGSVSVKDSEVSSVSTKNLIVVGGSCVNTVAAKLLGSDSPLCGDDFTAKTGVSSGQYLIQTFASPYSSSAVATLVAGFNAGDTTNAAKYLITQVVDTTVGQKYVGTSETSATASVVSSTEATA